MGLRSIIFRIQPVLIYRQPVLIYRQPVLACFYEHRAQARAVVSAGPSPRRARI